MSVCSIMDFCVHLSVMKRVLQIVLCVVVFSVHAENSEWMATHEDSVKLCDMAILGAHDAATGHGFSGFRGLFVGPFARTQTLTISELWDAGVRAFDLRPVVKDGELPIYHGSERTKLTLNDALKIIAHKLREHPSEVAVILLRQEQPGGDWAELTAESITESGLQLMPFSESMTLGEVRGRVLVLSRNVVAHSDVIHLSGWRHDSIAQVTADNGMHITVQDFYDCTEPGALDQKKAMFEKANSAEGWVINYLSGYTRERSSKSSREVSETMMREMELLPSVKGIIMCDFIMPGDKK